MMMKGQVLKISGGAVHNMIKSAEGNGREERVDSIFDWFSAQFIYDEDISTVFLQSETKQLMRSSVYARRLIICVCG